MVWLAPLATYCACVSTLRTPSSTMNGTGQFHASRIDQMLQVGVDARSRCLSRSVSAIR